MGESSAALRLGRPGIAVALAAAALVAVLLLASNGPVGLPLTPSHLSTDAKTGCKAALALPTPICHVMVVYLENQEFSAVMNTSFEGQYLAPHYALAGQYYSVEHYSFPNYLAATAGYVTNYQHLMNRTNIVNLIQNRTPAISWDAYMGGMPHACYLDQNFTADYRAAHNPFVYYEDIWNNQTYCRNHDLPWNGWLKAVSAGKLPNYAFISPNTTNDCWKFGLASCDAWLQTWLTPLVNASFFKNTAMFITYDEGAPNDTLGVNNGTGGGHIYTVLVSPYACPGYVSQHQYNAYNLLTTTEWLLHIGTLGIADNWTTAPPMADMFCFKNGTAIPPGNETPLRGLPIGGHALPGAPGFGSTVAAVRASESAPRTRAPVAP